MTKLVENIKKILKNNFYLAIIILFILELFISIWITPDRYDSAFFIQKMKEMSLSEFLSMRYNVWTSRILIEAIVCTVLSHNRLIWVMINTFMMTLIGYSIMKLFLENDKNLIKITICLILLYPLNKIATCDWGAGSINYTWPLAMLLFSSIGLKKIINGEKIKKLLYPLYFCALLYAANQEQTCVIAFGLYTMFLVISMFDYFKNKKKIRPFLIIQEIVTILGLVLIATCPGNYVRKIEEMETYFMNFQTFNIFDKFSLGLTATVNNLLVSSNVVFIVFSVISATYIFKVYKNNLYRVIALVPVVLGLAFGLFKNVLCAVFPYFQNLYDLLVLPNVMLTPTNYTNFFNFMPLIFAFVLLASITLNILLIFKNLKNNIAILIYVLGVGSRVAIGFSPTVFASTERTFLFFDFALIIISILVWKEFIKETDKSAVNARNRLAIGIGILSVLEYIHTVIYALVSQM